jgi:uncharacterized RDD family membrane protein YckC
MEYEDRIVIPTPEGVQVGYVLAGVGSRFVAFLVDWILKLAVFGALAIVLAAIGDDSLTLIGLTIAAFAVAFGYDIAFEVWGGGQTPAKRWSGLRVVMAGGQPVALGPSTVRNVLRLVDEPLTAFAGGAISILVTAHNQRLGDLAAGTIVIREPRAPEAPAGAPWHPVARPSASVDALGLDLTAVSPAEIAAVTDFLARRSGLAEDARERVSRALADALAPKVGGLPPDARTPEWILETIAAAARQSS